MAFDFFTVPTLRFRTLYCFFVIEHGRRRILHFNCTAHPTSDWIVQQLRDALPLPCPYRYVLFDRDAKFGNDVVCVSKGERHQTDANECSEPMAERNRRTMGRQCSPEMLDHIIPLNESHLRRLGCEYLAYYHEDRTHIGLQKNTPPSSDQARPNGTSQIVSQPRLGGLHHRYGWTAAA